MLVVTVEEDKYTQQVRRVTTQLSLRQLLVRLHLLNHKNLVRLMLLLQQLMVM